MFAYPKKAEFNGVVPKSKIYAHARPGRAVKALFVSQVGEIVWKYKLSPETTNLPARHGITEIQVFELTLRTEHIAESVLRTIDKAIPFPVLFQLTHADRIRFAVSWKRPSDADASKWVIESSFITAWQALAVERPPLPLSLDLAALYDQLVRHHIPLESRTGESLRDHVARYLAIRAKEKECRRLESRLGNEKQFNRKVDLNASLRALHSELDSLLSA